MENKAKLSDGTLGSLTQGQTKDKVPFSIGDGRSEAKSSDALNRLPLHHYDEYHRRQRSHGQWAADQYLSDVEAGRKPSAPTRAPSAYVDPHRMGEKKPNGVPASATTTGAGGSKPKMPSRATLIAIGNERLGNDKLTYDINGNITHRGGVMTGSGNPKAPHPDQRAARESHALAVGKGAVEQAHRRGEPAPKPSGGVPANQTTTGAGGSGAPKAKPRGEAAGSGGSHDGYHRDDHGRFAHKSDEPQTKRGWTLSGD